MSDRRRTLLIFALLYPLGAGAVAINAFFASLLAAWAGARVLTPVESCLVGVMLGLPASYAFARHVNALVRRADAEA